MGPRDETTVGRVLYRLYFEFGAMRCLLSLLRRCCCRCSSLFVVVRRCLLLSVVVRVVRCSSLSAYVVWYGGVCLVDVVLWTPFMKVVLSIFCWCGWRGCWWRRRCFMARTAHGSKGQASYTGFKTSVARRKFSE